MYVCRTEWQSELTLAMKISPLLSILLLWCIPILGQVAKYSNDFMFIGVGAKWMGMGNTGVAGDHYVSAAYWNPAGLLGLDSRYQVEGLHASYFAGMASFNHVALGYKPDTSLALAFTLLRFGVDDIPNTTDLIDSEGNISYDRLKSFSVADYAMLFSVARASQVPNLILGGNAKLIYRNVGKFATAWGFGVDVAARYRCSKWHAGVMLRDVTTTFNLWSFNSSELEITIGDSTFNAAPDNNLELTMPRLILGIGRSISINENFVLTPELNVDLTFDGKRNTLIAANPVSLDPHLGMEVAYKNLLFIRAGVNNIQNNMGFSGKEGLTLQPALGVGLKFRSLSIDYAMTNAGSVGYARYSNIFTVRWGFDGQSPGN